MSPKQTPKRYLTQQPYYFVLITEILQIMEALCAIQPGNTHPGSIESC